MPRVGLIGVRRFAAAAVCTLLVALSSLAFCTTAGAAPRPLVAPANDNFANAATMPAAGGTVTGSTVGATEQVGEPDHGGTAGSHSIWWKWTPIVSGNAVIDTCTSSYDTLLGVYTGSAVNKLTTITGDDDGRLCGDVSLQSSVYFDAVAGTKYSIAVDGYNGASGAVTMHVFAPGVPGDNFAAPQIVPFDGGTFAASTVGATKETGEPNHAGNAGGHSVWWTFTPQASGTARIQTCASKFNTLLGVYTGSAVSSLTTVASNDDSTTCGSTSNRSSVSFAATSGTTYAIAVDGFNGASGAAALQVTPPAASPPGAPTLTSIASGNGWITVGWDPPPTNGATISKFTVTLSTGETLDVPGNAIAGTIAAANGAARTAHVTATNQAGTGAPSAESSPVTPAAADVGVTSTYDDDVNARLLKNATYFGQSTVDAQRTSVGILAYVIGLIGSSTPTPQTAPGGSGSHSYTTTWAPADQSALVTVMREYCLTPADTQQFSVQVVGYLLSLGGS